MSFSEASRGLRELVEADITYADRKSQKKWLLCWDRKKRPLALEEFDWEKAIALLDKGQAVIPRWLEIIHQSLV